jgi:CrcB protein
MLFGAAGAGARYLLSGVIAAWLANGGSRTWLGAAVGPGFPLGTLVINVSGSFLLAFITTLATAGIVNADLRYALGTGFLGAYTTFSTFEMETDALLRSGQGGLAAAYVLGNVIFGFAGVLLGRLLAEPFAGYAAGGVP